jgi:hypothetical protein
MTGSSRVARTDSRAPPPSKRKTTSLREKDHPPVDSLRDDRHDAVGEELLRGFARARLYASDKSDPIALLAFLGRRGWF